MSEHSAHLTSLPFGFRTWLWRYTCLLLLISYIFVVVNFDALAQASDFRIERRQHIHTCLHSHVHTYTHTYMLISMLWHGQAIFKSKGDKLPSANSTACPYDQRASSPPHPTAIWLSHLALAIYIIVVLNFDALTQANVFQIERRQVVFLCWMQDLNQIHWNPMSSRLNTRWQPAELSRINLTLELNSPSLWSASTQPTPPHYHLYLALAIYMFVVVNFDALAQAIDFQMGRRQVVFLCWLHDLNQILWNRITSRPNAHWQTDWAIEDEAKIWTWQPVRIISEHSANSTTLPFVFRTWLWRYTCLLLSITMLWLRQVIFKSKGDKLSSSAECRIWTRVFGTESPADWMPVYKPTELSRIKLKLELNSPSLWSANIHHTRPHCHWLSHLVLAIYIFVVLNFVALEQASDFQIERRQVVFLCNAAFEPDSLEPNLQQTECPPTNRLS